MKNDEKIYAIDFIKSIAIIMVIITHVSVANQAFRNKMLFPYFVLPAVPIFVICSGIVLTLSYDNKKLNIIQYFKKEIYLKKLKRVIFPYIVTLVILIIGIYIYGVKKIPFSEYVKIIFSGGRGPGGFYILIYLQLMVIFPFVKFSFDRDIYKTIIYILLFTIGFEYICFSRQISLVAYNYISVRFLFSLVLGMIMVRYFDIFKDNMLPIICMVIGGIYLYCIYYGGYKSVISYAQVSRNFISQLWAFGIVYYLMRTENFLKKYKKIFSPFFYIGRASYHIMLFQMIYFYFARKINLEEKFGGSLQIIMCDVIISLIGGCLFYKIENMIGRMINTKFTNVNL